MVADNPNNLIPRPLRESKPCAVNHPKHYNTGKIEVIDFIEDQQLDFPCGNAVKYIARARHKGTELQDLEKAAWYLARKIAGLKKQQQSQPERTA